MVKLPVPVPVKTRLLTVAGLLPGLVNLNCSTGKPVTPGSWVELVGGLGPILTDNVTGVGVAVSEGVDVKVSVLVGVPVLMGVADGLKVPVKVKVGV